MQFGRLTEFEAYPPAAVGVPALAVFACECGWRGKKVRAEVRRGNTLSCGCLRRDTSARRMTTHGLTARGKIPVSFRRWWDMLDRCYSSRDKFYHRYGGRGIKVADRWHKYENFVSDMGEPPLGLSLDRIDNDGDYSKENCRWATAVEQANNKSNSRAKRQQ